MKEEEKKKKKNIHKTNPHHQGTDNQSRTPTIPLGNPHSHKGEAHVDGAQDDGAHVAVADTGRPEDQGAIVEEVIHARELLASLQEDANEEPMGHAGVCENAVPLCSETR